MKIEPLTEEQKIALGVRLPNGDFNWKHQYEQTPPDDEGIIYCDDPHLTEQHHAKDLDLNNIIKRYGIKDGSIPPAALLPAGLFGDFTNSVDLRDALDRSAAAADKFNRLPAELRAQFNNDPVFMFEWVSNPANIDEAVTLGLLNKRAINQDTLKDTAKAVSPST